MDSRGRNLKKGDEDSEDRGRSWRQRSGRHAKSETNLDEHPDALDVPLSLSRQTSATNTSFSKQLSNTLSRQRSGQTDGRQEERRGFSQKFNFFSHRPHSSNASRPTSTNTSSSSLPSLMDQGFGEVAPGDQHPQATGSTYSANPSRAGEPPLSPLSEIPAPIPRRGPVPDELPVYPDQSYASLQRQIHPAPYPPPFLRSRSSYPSHQATSSQSSVPVWTNDIFDRSYSRTAGNTPISSPGLFSSHPSRFSSVGSDDSSRCTGSFLHPTHLQEPKETHTVEVDRDVVTGNKLINDYEILEELGRGEHGKVKLGRHMRTGQTVAIKIVQRYSKRRRLGKLGNPEDKVKKEVAILKKARHPNVVSLLEVIDDPNQQKVYIVLEYVENSEILWRKKGLREIVTVDKRRLWRESQGLPDSPSFIEESQQFVRNIQVHRQRREAARKNRRSMTANIAGIPAWSLEHGGESDDEAGPEIPIPYYTRSRTQEPVEASASPSHSVSSTGDFDRRIREAALAAVEGSMYGAYASDPALERRFSTASSVLGYQSSESDWISDDDDLSYVPCLTMSEARSAFRDAVLGTEYLHYQGIIHRDIKPANLLVTANHRVKISDFGVSYLGRPIRDDEEEQVTETDATELDDARELSKTVGTPAFYAPELCYTGNEFEEAIGKVPKITGAIDVWALGVTLYGMIYGRLPFVADDEFGLFHNIVKQDVFIPTKRLKAVEVVQGPPSQAPVRPPPVMNSNKRTEEELCYETVNDDLRDLLARLLEKDPTKRITLKEIKHHPWVLKDIPEPTAWIEETDPSYQSKGKKIEVSNEEVIRAVTKMPFIQRVRSNVARWGGSFFGRSKDGRKRAPSSAGSPDTAQYASSSSSMTIGKDLIRDIRRASLRGDEEVARTPKPREGEHPLSQSVVASPDTKESRDYFGEDLRPNLPERTTSTTSNAPSVKTLRPPKTDPPLSGSVTSSPGTVESTSSHLSGLFGGAGRRLAKSLHLGEKRGERSPSSDQASIDDDPHGAPSVAVSATSAIGHVQTPNVFGVRTPLTPERHSDCGRAVPASSSHRRSISHQSPPTSHAELFKLTRETLLRHRNQHRGTGIRLDTDLGVGRSVRETNVPSRIIPMEDEELDPLDKVPSMEARDPIGSRPMTSPPSAITISSSSAGDFTSGMSYCASHPSIPSVVSGASSLSGDGSHAHLMEHEKGSGACVPRLLRTGETVKARDSQACRLREDESRYDCDDEDEGSSSDECITFGKKR